MNHKIPQPLPILAALLIAGTADAATVTYSYSGTVSDSVAGMFSAGETATISFSFDSLASDLYPELDYLGRYGTVPTTYSIASPTLGYRTMSDATVVVVIQDHGAGDELSFGGYVTDPPVDAMGFGAQWRDDTGTVFSSDALPLTPPDPASFNATRWGGIRIDFSTAQQCGSGGPDTYECNEIVLLSPTPVPLPATAWLMLSGLGLIGGAAAKRRVR